jgi:hypothetical protein
MIFVRSMFSQRGGVGYTIFYCNQLSIPVKFISFAEIFFTAWVIITVYTGNQRCNIFRLQIVKERTMKWILIIIVHQYIICTTNFTRPKEWPITLWLYFNLLFKHQFWYHIHLAIKYIIKITKYNLLDSVASSYLWNNKHATTSHRINDGFK